MSEQKSKPATKSAEPTTDKPAESAKAAAPVEPTSEKLVQLKKDKATAMSAAAKAQMAGDEKGAEDKFLEVYKIGEDIKRELAAIKQHEAELLKKEKEAATVKLFDDAIEAYVKNQEAIGDKKLSIEQKNELNNDYHAKREAVVNRLLGSRPAATGAAKTASGTKGATGSAIHDLIVSKIAEGKTLAEAKKEIVEAGYSRGTTGSVATQMIKDGEVVA
jgi:hypothetical protein